MKKILELWLRVETQKDYENLFQLIRETFKKFKK